MRWADRLLLLVVGLLPSVMALAPRALPVWIILAGLCALPRGLSYWLAHWPHYRPALLLLLVLLSYGLASLAWAASPAAGGNIAALFYLLLAGLALAGWTLADEYSVRQALGRALALGAVVGLCLWAGELIFDHPLHRLVNDIPPTSDIKANAQKRAEALLALLVWPLALLLGGQRWRLLLLPLIMLVLLLGLTSRSAMLGLATGVVFAALGCWRRQWARRGMLAALLVGLVGSVPLALLIPEWPSALTASLFDSAQHRLEIWHETALRITHAPWLGYGPDAARDQLGLLLAKPHFLVALPDRSAFLHPHHVFLQLWLDWGAMGAMLVGLALWYGWRASAPLNPPQQIALLGAAGTALLMLNTAFGLWQAWWLAGHLAVFWLIFTIVPAGRAQAADRPAASADRSAPAV